MASYLAAVCACVWIEYHNCTVAGLWYAIKTLHCLFKVDDGFLWHVHATPAKKQKKVAKRGLQMQPMQPPWILPWCVCVCVLSSFYHPSHPPVKSGSQRNQHRYPFAYFHTT